MQQTRQKSVPSNRIHFTRSELRSRSRRGFSLMECSVSVLLVGLLMVASLNSFGAAKRHDLSTVQQVSGRRVVCDLLNEILLQSYKEPVDASIFGPEPGETVGGNRTLFDDVDDYNGLSSVPKDRSGVAIPGFTGWTEKVTVQWADPNTYAPTSATNTGLKRITVTINRGTTAVTSIVGFRSVGWVDTIPTPYDATGNHPPVAVATAPGGQIKQKGKSLSFDGTNSSDTDGNSLSYVWDFGDGTTGTGATVSKSYGKSSIFTCTLTVYDGNGGTATSSLIVIIF